MSNQKLYQYLLLLGDNSLILGHRLSELCGHGPSLETDIALTNMSLDLYGQVRSYFQYAAKIKGDNSTEDSVAFLRTEREYHNSILVEQENKDFAHVIVRQFFFDVYHNLLLDKLKSSKDEIIAAIAHKSIKESDYHLRFSSQWVRRLGGGTVISHEKTQAAVTHLYPFIHELVSPIPIEKEMQELGIGINPDDLRDEYFNQVQEVLNEVNLEYAELKERFARGKTGIHTEQLGYILGELQYMQRAYPNMQW